MSELKFRVWDKDLAKYLEGCEIDSLMAELSSEDDGRGIIIKQICPARYKFEQYTGLKDKNDKEICEGDIVMARWYRAKNARLDTKGEIKFDDGWFYIYDDPDGQDRLGVPIHNCYNIEVIGNIHENKELLEGE